MYTHIYTGGERERDQMTRNMYARQEKVRRWWLLKRFMSLSLKK